MRPSLLRTTLISALGGVFEFYDFVIFAVFAPHIGQTFFPPEAGESAQTLKAFAVFAVGYLARPLGGLLWAHVADRRGRAYVFSHTVLGMAASTLLIALLPGHATLGAAAPWLLVLLRLLQGMALGGEIPASLCWLVEHADAGKKHIAAATLMAGVNSGMLLGQIVAALLTLALGAAATLDWGWRLAFLFGSLVGVLAFFVRRHVGETEDFARLQQERAILRVPLRRLLADCRPALLRAMLLAAVHAWTVATLYLALPSFLAQTAAMPLPEAERLALLSASCGSVLYVLSGRIADRIGGARLCRLVLLAFTALALPCYAGVGSLGAWPLVGLGAVGGAFIGGYLALLPGMFPAAVRTSGLAASYDGAFALVGGAGPFVMLWLNGHGGPLLVGAASAALGLLALLALRQAAR
jgi:predicted MFS family arabinose efflux permease